MTVPASRGEFKQWCLRKLGKPVIQINVDDDQVDDRIDEALRYYWDYHFDGTTKIYYKHQVTDRDKPGSVSDIEIINGGQGYSNTDQVVITSTNPDGLGAEATITTNSSGTITSVNIINPGNNYHTIPNVTINTTTGSGANFNVFNGGYINMPENIIGVVHLFPIGDPAMRTNDLFNIRYQIALNDLYTLTSVSMVPYYMTMQHLALIQEVLVGKQPIRYNRHKNKLYADMDWAKFDGDEFMLVEAYEVVDPDVYTDAWGDRWLQNYATALIKRQWGNNMKKFSGMQLPGGVTMNGQQIYEEAQQEIDKLESEMINSYSLPVSDMIG